MIRLQLLGIDDDVVEGKRWNSESFVGTICATARFGFRRATPAAYGHSAGSKNRFRGFFKPTEPGRSGRPVAQRSLRDEYASRATPRSLKDLRNVSYLTLWLTLVSRSAELWSCFPSSTQNTYSTIKRISASKFTRLEMLFIEGNGFCGISETLTSANLDGFRVWATISSESTTSSLCRICFIFQH